MYCFSLDSYFGVKYEGERLGRALPSKLACRKLVVLIGVASSALYLGRAGRFVIGDGLGMLQCAAILQVSGNSGGSERMTASGVGQASGLCSTLYYVQHVESGHLFIAEPVALAHIAKEGSLLSRVIPAALIRLIELATALVRGWALPRNLSCPTYVGNPFLTLVPNTDDARCAR
jgi:hypothetical protein